MNNTFKLIVSVAIPLLAGFLGSVFTGSTGSPQATSGLTWYAGLLKPELNPPSWVFGPVWTTLYVLMGVALYLVWSHTAKATAGQAKELVAKYIGLWFFAIQLALNFLWSIIFFGLQNPGLALVEIVFLWISILATIVWFKRVSRLSAWLLVPYLVWVSFAVYLNFSIWGLN